MHARPLFLIRLGLAQDFATDRRRVAPAKGQELEEVGDRVALRPAEVRVRNRAGPIAQVEQQTRESTPVRHITYHHGAVCGRLTCAVLPSPRSARNQAPRRERDGGTKEKTNTDALRGDPAWNHAVTMALAPGSRIGPYEILTPVGAGGMGQVFRAKDTRFGRMVAVKSMHDSFAGEPERIARFQREQSGQ